MPFRRTLGVAAAAKPAADYTFEELYDLYFSPDAVDITSAPRVTPQYTARLAEMKAEAERGLDNAKAATQSAGRSVTEWLKENKTAVYIGAGALFALALFRSSRG